MTTVGKGSIRGFIVRSFARVVMNLASLHTRTPTIS